MIKNRTKNRRAGWRIVVVILLAAALGFGYWLGRERHFPPPGSEQVAEEKVQYTCGMHPFIIRDEPGLCPICGMELTPMKPRVGGAGEQTAERRIKHWASPMDPTYVREEPGEDYMGHELVPVYEGGAAPGQIAIDPTTIQNMGVRTEAVERRNLERTVRTVGLVGYDESRRYSINSKSEGWIERLHINETGQIVKKGQPLLEIYSPELVAAQQEYLLAFENNRRLAESSFPEITAGAGRLFDATRTRLQYWDVSDRQIEELERTGRVRKTMTLYSPYGGVVTDKPAVEGMRAMSGQELLRIADISRVWVNADIYEFELPWIKTGLTATVELPFDEQVKLEGKISYIYPYLSGETRTARARLELANPGFKLKPGMFVNVLIDAEPVQDALAVPSSAVLRSGERHTVFVALGEGRFEPRTVTTGVSDNEGFTQVLSGLRMGERVVTSAQFMFDSESRLQEAVRKMLQPERAPAADHPKDEADGMEELFESEPQEQMEELFK
jgi:Cu(I)/Ag(I) efflux system membrane fusion protein/cobalt-zinc-cadmium efflux system membrane fusion protein